MSLAIVGKVGASIAFLGTSSIVGCVLIKPELFGIYSYVDMYAISTAVSGGATGELTDTNFQCKFVDSDAFDCEVFKLKTSSSNTKKQYEINDPNDNLFEKTKPTVTELQTAHTVFKIKFKSGKHWDQAKHIDKNIEIVPKSNSENKKYADLKPLFAKHKGKVIGKTNYFVAKAKTTLSNVATSSTFTCSFINQTDTSSACTITEFTNSETGHNAESAYQSLIFAKPTSSGTTLTEITQHKHYLIQFTEDGNKQEIEGFNREITYSSTGNAGTTTTFTKVSPAVYDSNQDSIFIKSNL